MIFDVVHKIVLHKLRLDTQSLCFNAMKYSRMNLTCFSSQRGSTGVQYLSVGLHKCAIWRNIHKIPAVVEYVETCSNSFSCHLDTTQLVSWKIWLNIFF